MTTATIENVKIRHANKSGAYGGEIDHSLVRWELIEEISEALARTETSGRMMIGGQQYSWTI